MTQRIPIRLCIFSTMRTKDLSQVSGVLPKEAKDMGEILDEVVLVHFHKRYHKRILKENVHLITLPYIDPKTPLRFGISIFVSYLISIPILLKIALEYKINLFRADDIIISGLPCIIISKLLGIHCIVSIHGDLEEVISYKIGPKKKIISVVLLIINKIGKMVVSSADGCIVVNKKLETVARKKYGSRRVLLTYPNIDLSIFGQTESDEIQTRNFTILFVGRLEPEKGPINVLKVAESLRNVDFLVVGDGSLKNEMDRIIKEKKLFNVKLLGVIPHSILPKLYRSADVLLLPSYSEGLPIVMLEAMASELPVIVSNVGAVGEILKQNEGGFAVSPGNIEEILSKVSLLQKDKHLRSSIGRRGKTNVTSHFSDFVNTQVHLYKSVISGVK